MTPITGAPSATARSSSSASCASTSVSSPSRPRLGDQRPREVVVEVAQEQQRGVRAGLLRGAEVVGRREEALREERGVGRCARGREVVPGAVEALVDEHGDRRRARSGVRGGDRGGVGVRAQGAGRRRAALDLGDRAETRARRARRRSGPSGGHLAFENSTSCVERYAGSAVVDRRRRRGDARRRGRRRGRRRRARPRR